MRRAFAGIFLLSACHAPAPPAGIPAPSADAKSLNGRWVQEGTMMAYYIHGDSAEIMMFPPQGMTPRPWRAVGNVLEMRVDTLERHAFVISNDSLSVDWKGPRGKLVFHRLVTPKTPADIDGSWRSVADRQPSVFNFRSDGQMIVEVGVEMPGRMRGDTLVMRLMGSDTRLVFKRAGAGMQAVNVEMPGRVMRFTRRPWGCFGFKQVDLQARECR
jgi:hypothetical protein